jgi:hypothetical protein
MIPQRVLENPDVMAEIAGERICFCEGRWYSNMSVLADLLNSAKQKLDLGPSCPHVPAAIARQAEEEYGAEIMHLEPPPP